MKRLACLLSFIALGLVLASCDNGTTTGGSGDGDDAYTVTFNLNGGDGAPPPAQTVPKGGSITLPNGNGLTKTGYVFNSWNTQSDGTGDDYAGNAPYTPTASITLYVKWRDPSLTIYYTVTFDLNGGEGTPPEEQTVEAGDSIRLPGGDGLTKTGYDFNGWNTEPDGTGDNYWSNDNYTPIANITLYVKWHDPTAPVYTVTFDANGGVGTPPEERIVEQGYGISIPDGSGLTKTGYAFSGWNTEPDGTGTNYRSGVQYYDHYYPTTFETTLYAKWDDFRTLTQKLAWLKNNAQSNKEYILEVDADESIAPHTLYYYPEYYYNSPFNNITITLIGVGTNRTISPSSSDGYMFTVGYSQNSSVTLVLDDNITLQGRSDDYYSLVMVETGSTLVMNTGAKITGGGVSVGRSGNGVATFTMNGGEIYGNTDRGVTVYEGTFTKSLPNSQIRILASRYHGKRNLSSVFF